MSPTPVERRVDILINVAAMAGLMKRVCLISAVVVACLTLAVYATSRIDTPPPPASITTVAARSAADFVSQQMGLPNRSYPSSWTDTRGPHGSLGVTTGQVVVRGNCA